MPVDDWLQAQGEDAPLLFWAQTAHGCFGAPPAQVAVAVSGGSDSMAMLHLMARAAPHAGWSVRAVTVNSRCRLSMRPAGTSRFWARRASSTSCTVRPWAARRSGCSQMRMA